jgi:hypothetical protein
MFRFIRRNVKEFFDGWKSFFKTLDWVEYGKYAMILFIVSMTLYFGVQVQDYFRQVLENLQSINASLGVVRGVQ